MFQERVELRVHDSTPSLLNKAFFFRCTEKSYILSCYAVRTFKACHCSHYRVPFFGDFLQLLFEGCIFSPHFLGVTLLNLKTNMIINKVFLTVPYYNENCRGSKHKPNNMIQEKCLKLILVEFNRDIGSLKIKSHTNHLSPCTSKYMFVLEESFKEIIILSFIQF